MWDQFLTNYKTDRLLEVTKNHVWQTHDNSKRRKTLTGISMVSPQLHLKLVT